MGKLSDKPVTPLYLGTELFLGSNQDKTFYTQSKSRKIDLGTTTDPNLDLGRINGTGTASNLDSFTRNSSTFSGKKSPPRTNNRSPSSPSSPSSILSIDANCRKNVGDVSVIRIVSDEMSRIQPLTSPPTINISFREMAKHACLKFLECHFSTSIFFKKLAIPGVVLFIFTFSIQLTVNVQIKFSR